MTMMTGLAVVTFTVLVLGVQSSYGINSTNEACRNPVYHVQNLHQTNHCVVSKIIFCYLALIIPRQAFCSSHMAR